MATKPCVTFGKRKQAGRANLFRKALIIEMFFAAEQKAIDDMETVIAAVKVRLKEMGFAW